MSRGGLGRGKLGCSLEIRERNKDREGNEHDELEKSAGRRTTYRDYCIPSRNTASAAGWSIVLLGHLLQVKP